MIELEIKQKLKEISAVKGKINKLGELRPGSLREQWNVCGKANCKCKDTKSPQKHGPYFQLSYTRYGKSRNEFIRKEDVNTARKQIENYKKFISLKDKWIDLCIEISKLEKELKKQNK